jgi:hypothetical protein
MIPRKRVERKGDHSSSGTTSVLMCSRKSCSESLVKAVKTAFLVSPKTLPFSLLT